MINKALIAGRITKDIELKSTTNGVSVVAFTVAVQRSYKDANGERQADFINCVAFKSKAEFISKYFSKGDSMFVEGSIQSRSWEDGNGNKRYATEVIANEVGFFGSKKKEESPEELPQMPEEFSADGDNGDLPF